MMKITLLGTGGSAGVPQLGGKDGHGDFGLCDPAEPKNIRTRSSVFIESGQGTKLLIDTSPDLRAQFLREGITSLDAVFFTHAHADHIGGIDDLRILNQLMQRPVKAYAAQEVMDELTARFAYIFQNMEESAVSQKGKNSYFFRPCLIPLALKPEDTLEVKDLRFTLLEQDHGFRNSYGLRTENFAYCTDLIAFKKGLSCLQGVKKLVIGCFQRHGPHATHAWSDLVLEWWEELGQPEIILTHMGYSMDYRSLRQFLPEKITVGFDGFSFEI